METTNTLAWTQVAEIELIYKSKVKASDRPKVTTSSDAYHLLKQNWDENKIEFVEQFKVLFLNRNSMIYLNGKLLEAYSYVFDNTKPIKATILRDTVIANGKKFGKNILEEDFSSDSIVDNFRAEFEFIKDTVFTWQEKIIPALVIKATYYASFKSKFITSIHTDYQFSSIAYQAKGVGTIRIRILKTVDNKTKNIDLVQIKSSTSR